MNRKTSVSVALLLTLSSLAASRPAKGQLTSPAATTPPQRQPVVMTLPPGVVAGQQPSSTAPLPGSEPDPAVEIAIARLVASARNRHVGATLAQGAADLPDEPARLARSDRGWLRSAGAPPGRPFTFAAGDASATAADRATRFLKEHAAAFGVAKPGVELHAERVKERSGRQFLRLGQKFRGVPVYGASAVVQFDAAGDVEFVISDLARDDARFHGEGFSIAPLLSAEEATVLALAVPALGAKVEDLVASAATLMLYEPSVIGNFGGSRLVWHVEVTSASLPIDELVLVDAQSREIAFHFSQIMSAKYREVYDCGAVYGDACGTPARAEGWAPSGTADVNTVYNFLGDVYDYYWSRFGRDSVDGAGMTLRGLVRYCDFPPEPCPYPNAYWDRSKNQMVFGAAFIADDVVGHEVTHGVTSYESNLIYWGESGAINESLSDIFGEFVDLDNGAGTDTPAVRWITGEDLPVASYRSMKNPPDYNQPDRRFSSLWYTGYGDNRGVHRNSGVGNKLAYLLTDGDSFNGWEVEGLGIPKVGALFYEAQVVLLFNSADYYDLYEVLRQAAINNGWTLAERANLERACRAVEIAFSGTRTTVTSQGFEGSFPPAGWAVTGGNTRWGLSSCNVYGNATGKAWCAAGGAAPQPTCGIYVNSMNTWLIYGPFSLAGADRAWMESWLWSHVEEDYDYVFLGVSTNGTNYYGDVVSASTGSQWVRELLDFNRVGGVVGQPNVWVAFWFYSDALNSGYNGSYVDDVWVRKTSCVAPQTPSLSATGSVGSGVSYSVSWNATSPLNTYLLDEATNPSFTGATTYTGSGTVAWFSHSVASPTTYYYRVRATDLCGSGTYTSTSSNTGSTLVSPPAQVLTVFRSGGGTGTVNSDPAGISCGATCAASFSYGTVVTLSATPTAGSVFVGWSGEGCSGTGICQVTMSQARNVTATFSPSGATLFYPVTPCRLFDTRKSEPDPDAASPSLAPGQTRTFSVGTRCGRSVATDRSLSVNVTVAGQTADGELAMYRGDLADEPVTSVISFMNGKTRANNGFLELSRDADGTFKVRNRSASPVDFILDVNGVFR